ncbi:DUF5959 family protein [Streptomyces sp. NPDC005408]|uniref:DUF5959 family protein n=1 Tax=Streptomyces sp. NPDC005408 TaxID=3155341 RepID=UPI0033BBB308
MWWRTFAMRPIGQVGSSSSSHDVQGLARSEVEPGAGDRLTRLARDLLRRDHTAPAGLVVSTPFVSGSIDLVLSASKLESWAVALNRLDAGEDVAWMEWDRGPSLFVQLNGERDCPEVVVEDESGSMVTVRVPVVPPDDWIAAHQQRLHRVTAHWVPMLSA